MTVRPLDKTHKKVHIVEDLKVESQRDFSDLELNNKNYFVLAGLAL